MLNYTNHLLTTWRDGEVRDIHADMMHLAQRGGNKQPISNQQNVYAVFLLTFDFCLAVLATYISVSYCIFKPLFFNFDSSKYKTPTTMSDAENPGSGTDSLCTGW